MKYVQDYNACNNQEVTTYEKDPKKLIFRFNPRLGVNLTALKTQNTVFDVENVDFENKIGFRVGLELSHLIKTNGPL